MKEVLPDAAGQQGCMAVYQPSVVQKEEVNNKQTGPVAQSGRATGF